jgi:GT2 family glycosyltransferase
MMSKLSVVIPFYNHWDLVHQSLFDLYQHCRNSLDEVLVVNDASTDDTVYQGLMWWKEQKMLPLKELQLSENQRFLRASNKGMAKASGDILVLLSNDVRVKDDLCRQIINTISVEHYGERVLVGGRLLGWDTGWNTFDGKTFPYLEGWLLACTKTVWKELGGFDDIYAPNDFEDVDLSTRAVSLGYSLVNLDNPRVTHIGAQSIGYNPEREAITKRNREKFRAKWIK